MSQAFATLWLQADKVVHSAGLAKIPTNRTQPRSEFDPAEVQRPKVGSPKPLTADSRNIGTLEERTVLCERRRAQVLRFTLLDNAVWTTILGIHFRDLPAAKGL